MLTCVQSVQPRLPLILDQHTGKAEAPGGGNSRGDPSSSSRQGSSCCRISAAIELPLGTVTLWVMGGAEVMRDDPVSEFPSIIASPENLRGGSQPPERPQQA